MQPKERKPDYEYYLLPFFVINVLFSDHIQTGSIWYRVLH